MIDTIYFTLDVYDAREHPLIQSLWYYAQPQIGHGCLSCEVDIEVEVDVEERDDELVPEVIGYWVSCEGARYPLPHWAQKALSDKRRSWVLPGHLAQIEDMAIHSWLDDNPGLVPRDWNDFPTTSW